MVPFMRSSPLLKCPVPVNVETPDTVRLLLIPTPVSVVSRRLVPFSYNSTDPPGINLAMFVPSTSLI